MHYSTRCSRYIWVNELLYASFCFYQKCHHKGHGEVAGQTESILCAPKKSEREAERMEERPLRLIALRVASRGPPWDSFVNQIRNARRWIDGWMYDSGRRVGHGSIPTLCLLLIAGQPAASFNSAECRNAEEIFSAHFPELRDKDTWLLPHYGNASGIAGSSAPTRR